MSLRVRIAQLTGCASVLCWLLGHEHALHEVTRHGACWVCPNCRRWHHAGLRIVLPGRRRMRELR